MNCAEEGDEDQGRAPGLSLWKVAFHFQTFLHSERHLRSNQLMCLCEFKFRNVKILVQHSSVEANLHYLPSSSK